MSKDYLDCWIEQQSGHKVAQFVSDATMQMFIGTVNDIDIDCSSGTHPQTREGKRFLKLQQINFGEAETCRLASVT